MIDEIWNSLPAKITRNLSRIYDLPLRYFIPGALILMIFQNGIWVIPNIEVLRSMSSDITKNMLLSDIHGQYLYSSFLGLALAWITDSYRSTFAFAAMHFVALIVGTTGLSLFIRSRHGNSSAKLFLIALLSAPISNILLNWLGISDVFTYIFGTILAVSGSIPVLFLASVLLGVSHMEQGTIIALILIAKLAIVDEIPTGAKVTRIFAIAGGIAVAKIFFTVYFNAFHFNLTFTRAAFATPHFAYLFISGFLRNFSVTIYAFYSAAWILVAFTISQAINSKEKRFIIFLVIANLIAATTSAMVYDSTRDFSLIIWPSFIAALIYVSKNAGDEHLKKASILTFVASLLLPKIIIWEGKLQSSAFFYDILYVLEKITHKSLIEPLNYIHIGWPFAW